MSILEARGLGRRHHGEWALRDVSLALPAGRVAALIGPNGAGKTTLLHLAAGLTRPSEGLVRVLDGLTPGSTAALAGIGFVAQDAPLYWHLSVADMLLLARSLNRGWDLQRAAARIADLGIPPRRLIGALSGGHQAQVALTIALAKRPRLLILDEPVARLDPLARHDFMGLLMAAVAEDGLSVIFSSHVLAEFEPVADYLVVLNAGRLQVAGPVDQLLATHRVLAGPAAALSPAASAAAVRVTMAGAQAHALVRGPSPDSLAPPGFTVYQAGLAELVLGYLAEPGASALPGPALAS